MLRSDLFHFHKSNPFLLSRKPERIPPLQLAVLKAIKLLAILELAKRLSGTSFRKRPVFTEPGAIADYYMQKLRFLTVEQVYVLFFNTKCIFLGDKLLTVGTVNSSLLSPREIFIEAVKRNAVNIILVHNHPSGDPGFPFRNPACPVSGAKTARSRFL